MRLRHSLVPIDEGVVACEAEGGGRGEVGRSSQLANIFEKTGATRQEK